MSARSVLRRFAADAGGFGCFEEPEAEEEEEPVDEGIDEFVEDDVLVELLLLAEEDVFPTGAA
jgi:hypothetical protein